jgi:hypothetical protein
VTALAFRNQLGTGDLSIVSSDTGNNLLIGTSSGSGGTYVYASTSVVLSPAGGSTWTFGSTQLQIEQAKATPSIIQAARSSDVATTTLSITAQSAFVTAATNVNGGALRLQGGAAKTDGTTGLRGPVRLELSTAGVVMAEVAELAVGQRATVLNRGAAITATELPANAGDLVTYVGNAATAPTASPVSGATLYASGGILLQRASTGYQQAMNGLRAVRTWPSDANYTAVAGDYQANIMEFTGGALTLQRNLVVPLTAGWKWIVYNGTSGAQSIQVIGASGTGIVIANGKRAIVYADGTNIVRVTADV